MIFPFQIDYSQLNGNLFNCITIKQEYVAESPIDSKPLDYMVTTFPRCEDLKAFGFVYDLFNYEPVVFSNNQDLIIETANNLFSNSEQMGNVEAAILNITFKRLMKSTPTLSGRN